MHFLKWKEKRMEERNLGSSHLQYSNCVMVKAYANTVGMKEKKITGNGS